MDPKTNAFLTHFKFGEGLLAILTGSPPQAVAYCKDIPETLPTNEDVYFGPAMRNKQGNTKDDVLGTVALWVDVDDMQRPLYTLPPSAMVFSGHGWHLYWLLKEPLTDIQRIEELNQLLAKDVPTADPACWNVNRVLRIPGTINTKDPRADVVLRSDNALRYIPDDIAVLGHLDRAAKHKIRTGDSRGFRSRSERDWSIITDLVSAGATDELILLIFSNQPCGDKVREAPDQYLEHTIEKIRAKVTAGHPPPAGSAIEEHDDGYYMWSRRAVRRVSTFLIEPVLLLDGSAYQAEDAIVGKVKASGYTWDNTTFSRSAFTSIPKLDKECPMAAWQWLGRDEDVRALLPYLLAQLQEKGLPKIMASPSLGLHYVHDVPYFLGDKQVLSGDQLWDGFSGPIAWLPSKREHPKLDLRPDVNEHELEILRSLVPYLNEPQAVWPILGWYAAACIKPWLEVKGYRFPILNVVGTKGSGKTTLIQRIFMPLFGQLDPRSYDAGTTRFVTLALMGASNAIPVAFSEFRYDTVERFIRFILLAYDTGHDPRGRGDQTTVDYALSAPFTVDGEDLIEDPAARERIVVCHLHPNMIAEGSDSYKAYNEFRNCIPPHFGGHFIQLVLRAMQSGELETLLGWCREVVFSQFPSKLPDRVRQNHIVSYLGCVLWCRAVNMEPPSPEILTRSIASVYDIATGRARTLADAMVEDVVNACAQTTLAIRYVVLDDGRTLYFQLSSAHSWWLSARRRQGRGALERDAIRSQMKEAPYIREPKVIEGTWMYGVSLVAAQESGLDVPDYINTRELKVRF
jgi:hypothetical protein